MRSMLEINDINVMKNKTCVENLYIAKMHLNSDIMPMFVCLKASAKFFL